MDRVSHKKWVVLIGLLLALRAQAGTILVSPMVPPGPDDAQDGYPPSAFGQAPAKIPDGTQSDTYAATEGGAQRSPAGLVVGNEEITRRAEMKARQARTAFQPDFSKENHVPGLSTEFGSDFDTSSQPPQAIAKDVPSPQYESMAIRKQGVQEVSVIAGDLGFFPKTIFVTRDIPVRLFVTGASKNALCIMMDSFQVRKQVRAQKIEEITFTPSSPGRYRFYCPVNGMEGTMIVKELASNINE